MEIGVIYIIVLSLLAFLIALLWWSSSGEQEETYYTVSAGDVDKETAQTIQMSSLKNITFKADGQTIKPEDYTLMVVKGESMSTFNIHDGDIVFVKELINDHRYLLQKPTVVVFQIEDMNPQADTTKRIKYKLRRFITYYKFDSTNDDIDKLRTELASKKEIYNEDIISEFFDKKLPIYKECYLTSDISKADNSNACISLTWNNEEHKFHLSIHPTRLLFGVVKYAFDANMYAEK